MFIENWRGNDIPNEIRESIISDLNKMLLDRYLFPDLINYYTIPQSPDSSADRYALIKNLQLRNVKLVQWLAINLDEKGVFKNSGRLPNACKKELMGLNRVLLTDILGSEILDFLKSQFPIFVEKASVISTLKSAGYKIVHEYDFLKQYYFMEFKRRN